MADKVLFFLPASSAWARYLRRFIAIFILGGVALIIKDFIPMLPQVWIPILTGIGALLDKMIRDWMEKQ
jgi:hypothetical protein